MQYPKVDRSHIVPRNYLDNFAIDGTIAMRMAGWPASKPVSTRGAAVRKSFYSRTRPDGSRIDDVEWSLALLEGVTAPLLRNIGTAWPLDRDTKTKLAELFAYQLIRGPQWKDWHENFTRRFTANYQRDAGRNARDRVAIEMAGPKPLDRHLEAHADAQPGHEDHRDPGIHALDAARVRPSLGRGFRPSGRRVAALRTGPRATVDIDGCRRTGDARSACPFITTTNDPDDLERRPRR